MAATFYDRLRTYYEDVARVLRGESDAAAIFPNTTDKGIRREHAYAEFLRLHAPADCRVLYGGFLFSLEGSESSQIDIIIAGRSSPSFDFHNPDGKGKTFNIVDSTIAAISVKSSLDKKELEDSLRGFASIPFYSDQVSHAHGRAEGLNLRHFPYKAIFAYDGISSDSLAGHVVDFYAKNPSIPAERHVDLIHVAGKYVGIRSTSGMVTWDPTTQTAHEAEDGAYWFSGKDPDLQAMTTILNCLTRMVDMFRSVSFDYTPIQGKLYGIPEEVVPTARKLEARSKSSE